MKLPAGTLGPVLIRRTRTLYWPCLQNRSVGYVDRIASSDKLSASAVSVAYESVPACKCQYLTPAAKLRRRLVDAQVRVDVAVIAKHESASCARGTREMPLPIGFWNRLRISRASGLTEGCALSGIRYGKLRIIFGGTVAELRVLIEWTVPSVWSPRWSIVVTVVARRRVRDGIR